jgi:hypothetical protein
MALEKQLVPIHFTSGLDTKNSDKMIPFGAALLQLENACFAKPGELNRRYGLRSLGAAIEDGNSAIASAKALATFGDELLLFTGSKVYTYIAATGRWADRGACYSATATDIAVIHDNENKRVPDVAQLNGLRCVVWEADNGSGGVRYSIIDTETGAFVVSDGMVHETATGPRVFTYGDEFVLFYRSATNVLSYKRISSLSPGFLGAEVAFAANYASPGNVSMFEHPNGDLYIAHSHTFPGTQVTRVDRNFATVASLLNAQPSSRGSAIWTDSSGAFVYCAFASDTSIMIASIVNDLPAATWVTLDTVTASKVVGIVTDAPYGSTIFYQVGDVVWKNSLLAQHTVGTPEVFMRGVGIATAPFTVGDNQYIGLVHSSTLQSTFFVATLDGDIVYRSEPGLAGGYRTGGSVSSVCVDDDVAVFATEVRGRLLTESSYIFTMNGVHLTELDFGATFDSTLIDRNLIMVGAIAQSYDGKAFTEHGFHLFPEGVTAAENSGFSITVLQNGNGATLPEIIDIACVAGSKIASGQAFRLNNADFESNHVWYNVDGRGDLVGGSAGGTGVTCEVAILSTDTREQVATKTAVAISANLGAWFSANYTGSHIISVEGNTVDNLGDAVNLGSPMGVTTSDIPGGERYQYCVCYEWPDALGQIYRSAPSPVASIDPTSGASITITVPTLRLTNKTGVRIAVYRTLASNEVYYRATSLISPLLNDPTVDSVTFVDIQSDDAISGNELLYTSGGVLEHIAPPSCSIITSFNGRVFLAGLPNKNTIAFSKYTINGETVGFNDALSIEMEPSGGPVTGLGNLDDKLIIFKRNAIYVLAGEGPLATGEGSDYGTPRLVTSDVGCVDQGTIISTPYGLMFKSAKGIYSLDRAFTVGYVGAPVEAYNGLSITGASLVQEHNQVRFTTADGPCLVYDYFSNQWSTFTNHQATDCTVWRDQFVISRSTGKVLVEDPATWTDDGSAYRMRVVTSWLALTGLQGFQRVYRCFVLGKYKGKHKLRVRFGYDYKPEYPQEVLIDAYSLLDPGVYGSTSPYGTGVYGGRFPLYQFGIHLAKQKCDAFRVSLEDVQTSDFNEGLVLSGLTIQVGAKAGANKQPAATSLGSGSA